MKKIYSIVLSVVTAFIVLGVGTAFAKDISSHGPNGRDRIMNAKPAIHANDIVVNGVTIDGSGTAVGVLDDGMETNPFHPALRKEPRNAKYPGKGKVILGRNWANGLPDDFSREDIPYHGLHVAGIIAANGPDSEEKNAPQITGVAPETQLIFEKIQDRSGGFIVKDNIIAEAMRDAVRSGADVINMSFGTDSTTMNMGGIVNSAIKEVVGQGVAVVSTAGNQGYVGMGNTLPLATNPDYGVIARPGISPQTICANSYYNKKRHGFAFNLQGSKYNIEFDQTKYWGAFDGMDGKEVSYVVVDRPTQENLEAANITGKFVLIPRSAEGVSTEDNNLGGTLPDYIVAIRAARALGATGAIVYDNEREGWLFYPKLYKWNSATKNYDFDVWEEFMGTEDAPNEYPIVSIRSSEVERLKNAENKVIDFHAEKREYDDNNALELADFSSWGVSSDFVFKGDITTPSAGDVVSLGQKLGEDGKHILTTISNAGTSMSAPQISGALALVKQRLNVQYPELVSKNASTVYLMKNLLMSTCVPRLDPEKQLFYSPRAQGNGLMQVKEACQTDVVAISPTTDDDETGFAKTNLRMIKNHTINFDIELNNYGNTAKTYQPYLYVQTDEVKDGHFTLHPASIRVANVDQPLLKPVTVPAREQDSTLPGKKVFNVSYTIPADMVKKLSALAPNGYFAEGYVQLVPVKGTDGPELWHSFTGFDGDWYKAPVYDTLVYDLKDGQKPFYYNSKPSDTNSNRTGDLNSSHLETFIGGQKRYILGALPDYTMENLHVSDKHMALSPNGDGTLDTVNPVLTMLRNYNNISVVVKNSSGEQVENLGYGLGITDRHKNFYANNRADGYVTESPKNLTWNVKDADENPLPEDEYEYELSVTPDLINYSNALMQNEPKLEPNKRVFKIKVDLTPPKLQETQILREEGDDYIVKFTVQDPKLLNKNIDGSGLYQAELITDDGIKKIDFDAVHPESINEKEVRINKEAFKTARLKLTDWAFNVRTYEPRLTLKGLRTGGLDITSVDESNNGINVNYKLKNVKTNDEFAPSPNVPVGTYKIQPYNLPDGYTLADDMVDRIVTIKENETLSKKYIYKKTVEIYDVEFSDDTDSDQKVLQNKDIKLQLTNRETGMLTILDVSKYGASYGTKLLAGSYKIEFLHASDSDQIQVFNKYNQPVNYITVTPSALTTYKFTMNGSTPGDVKVSDLSVGHYLQDQTFIPVTANKGYKVGVEVYAHDGTTDAQPLFTINEDNQNAAVIEATDLNGGVESHYYLDLKDDTISKLRPGMILKPFAISPTGDRMDTNFVSVVGYNHNLMNSKFAYINKKIELLEDETKKQEVREIIKDLLYKVGTPRSSNTLPSGPRDFMINQDFADRNKESESKLPLAEVTGKYNSVNDYVNEKLQKVQAIFTEAGQKLDIPVLSLHKGYFPNIRTMVYPINHDGYYKFLELPTTTIVNDIDSVREAYAKMLNDDNASFEEDVNGRELNPPTEGAILVDALPELSKRYAGYGWRSLTEGIAADDELADANAVRTDSLSKMNTASLELNINRVVNIDIRTVENETGYNLPDRTVVLTREDGQKFEFISDIEGVVHAKDLPPGNYTLTRKDDSKHYWAYEPTTFAIAVASNGDITVDGQPYKNEIVVAYPVEHVISILVQDSNNNAVQGVHFDLVSNDKTVLLSAESGEDGMVTFEHVVPGMLILKETTKPENYSSGKTEWAVKVDKEHVMVDNQPLNDTQTLTVVLNKKEEPIDPTKDVTKSKVDVTESAKDLTESTVDVTESAKDLTESTADVTESTADVTESTADVTESTKDNITMTSTTKVKSVVPTTKATKKMSDKKDVPRTGEVKQSITVFLLFIGLGLTIIKLKRRYSNK